MNTQHLVSTTRQIEYFGDSYPAYPASQVISSLTNVNNYLLNFPMNQRGMEQLLQNGIATGSLTSEQRTIIEAELSAILNASSSGEILNIVNVVNQELSNSQMDPNTANTLYAINVGIDGVVGSGPIAGLNSNSKLTATTGIVGGAILAIGVVAVVVGMTTQDNENVVYGFMIAAIGVFIAVM